MAFCANCGQEVAAGTAFCAKCGAPTGAAGAPPSAGPSSGMSQAPAAGLEENLAGLLCYVLGWVTGLIFLLIDKRPFARFHAMQSLITFGGLHVINLILVFGGVAGMHGGLMMGGLSFMIYGLLSVVTLVAWIICMVKAFQGQRYKLPVIGDMAENYSR